MIGLLSWTAPGRIDVRIISSLSTAPANDSSDGALTVNFPPSAAAAAAVAAVAAAAIHRSPPSWLVPVGAFRRVSRE